MSFMVTVSSIMPQLLLLTSFDDLYIISNVHDPISINQDYISLNVHDYHLANMLQLPESKDTTVQNVQLVELSKSVVRPNNPFYSPAK